MRSSKQLAVATTSVALASRRRVAAVGVLIAALTAALATPAVARGSAGIGRGLIVFAGETDAGSQLWTVRPNGTHLRQITHVAGGAGQPDWSPDGRTIAFEWDVPSPDGPHVQIGLVDADGGHLRALPIDAGACVNGQPNFTANGQSVVYERFDCGTDDALFVSSLRGGDVRRLTSGARDGASEPNSAPDGVHLSYVRFDRGVEFQQALTVSDIQGRHPRDLVPPSVDVAVKTGWSPDSRHIVFTRDANPDPDTGVLQANVSTIGADGRGRRDLTSYRGGQLSAFAGSYSPDGRLIIYRLQDNNARTSGVWTMRTDGSHPKLLFSQPGLRARGIDWSARG